VPAISRLFADLSPLRESPPFRRLWAGTLVSSIGGALTRFAVTLQVYEITRSPFAVGVVGLVQLVPVLVIGLAGGSLADAIDRRKLVLVTNCLLTVVSVALAWQAFAGLSSLWLLYLLVGVQAAIGSVGQPARQTIIPGLLSAEKLPAGLALNRISFQVVLIGGPALAGLITAVPVLGLRGCYLIDAISFAASFYGVLGLPAMPPQDATPRPSLRAVAAGVSFIGRSQVLAGAFLADLTATIFGLPVALFPAINAERFGGDPRTLGLLTTAIGVGGLISAGLSGPLRHASRQGLVMLVAVAVWGAAFAGFAVAPTLWLTLAMLAVAGLADTVTVVLRGTIVQSVTPDSLRGRVTAADFVVGVGGGQLGNLEAGALGSLTSPTISALSGGLATVAVALAIGVAMPAFIKYRQLPKPAQEPAGPRPEPTEQPEPAGSPESEVVSLNAGAGDKL
jgi:MFS family permease